MTASISSLSRPLGFLISIPAGNARPAVMPSLAMKQSLVHAAGDLEVCYWKQKRNGRWKFKCDD
jgi:hypothetical protein